MQKLTKEEILSKLEKFESWTYEEDTDKLVSGFEFESFGEAVEFLNAIAELAEEFGHHPDLLIHDYKFVTIFTKTHDADGVTEKDFELIETIEKDLEDMI